MRALRVTIIGISVDLGLFGEIPCHPRHTWKLWLTILRLIPALVLWTLGVAGLKLALFWPAKVRREKKRAISHLLFDFLLSKQNYHEHQSGYLVRMEALLQRNAHVTNLSRIGQSLWEACKHKGRIPKDQDIYALHLGSMDYMNHASIGRFRQNLREMFNELTQKSPECHIFFIGPPDLVQMLTTPLNRQKILPLPGCPTLVSLHRWESFTKRLGFSPDADSATVTYARRLLELYAKVIQHELRRTQVQGLLKSFTFVDSRRVPIYRDEHRHRYFALDGMHLTAEGVAVAVNYGWPYLEKDLMRRLDLMPAPAGSMP